MPVSDSRYEILITDPRENVISLGDLGNSLSLNLSVSRIFKGTLNSNVTITLSGGKVGVLYLIHLTQDAVGSRIVSFVGGVTFPVGEIVQATANKHTLLTLYCLSGNTFLGSYKSGW